MRAFAPDRRSFRLRGESAAFYNIKRYLADNGPLRSDYSDHGFRKQGYINPGNFASTIKHKNTNKSWKPPQFVGEGYRKRTDESRMIQATKAQTLKQRDEERYFDYPFTGCNLHDYARRKQPPGRDEVDEYYMQDDEGGELESEKRKPRSLSKKKDEESSDEDTELVVRDRFQIRRTLAEDVDEESAPCQTFYRPDGRLIDIAGNMEDDWQPRGMDHAMVFEMVGLFRQGHIATWELEDVVRSFGAQIRPYHVFEVIKACKPTDSSIALAFFRWAAVQPYYQHVTATYNMMLKLLQEDRKYLDMVQLVKEMDAANVKKTAETYKILLASFFKGGLLEEALELFSQMEKSETRPQFNEYKYVIDRMLNAECYLVIPALFNSLTAAGHHPDAYTYNAVISSLCNVAKMDEALAVFGKMKQRSVIDLFTYTILIDGFIKCHNTPGATQLFLEMMEAGCLPGEEIFNLLFGLHIKDGQIEQAIGLFRRIAESGCQPTVKSYGMLLDTFAMVDDLDGAYRFFKELFSKNIFPSTVSCNALLSKLSKAGKTTLAFTFFNELKELPSIKPNGITYNIAIDLLGKTARYDDAWSMFSALKENGCTPCLITFNTLIIRLGRGGRIENCFDLYEEMKSRGIRPNQYTYCGLIDVLTRYDQTEHALEFIEEMKQQNLHPSYNSLQLVVKSLWKQGKLAAAKKVCEDYPGIYNPTLESRGGSGNHMVVATRTGAHQISASDWSGHQYGSMLEQ